MGGEKDQLVCVTGANGFIASWIVNYLIEKGYKVRGAVRGAKKKEKFEHLFRIPNADTQLELVEFDLMKSTEEDYRNIMKGCTFVIHTAMKVDITNVKPKDRDKEIINPAVEGTLSVLRAAHAEGIKRVVLTSSIVAMSALFEGEVDEKSLKETVSENSWLDVSVPRKNAYSIAKAKSEKAAWEFAKSEEHKIELVTICPCMILGPMLNKCANPGYKPVILGMKGKAPGMPNFKFWTADVRDVGLAHVLALEVPEANGHRFIMANDYTNMRTIARVGRSRFNKYGYCFPRFGVPDFFMRFMALFDSEIAQGAKILGHPIRVDNSPSKDILGLRYHTVEDSILDACDSVVIFGLVPRTMSYHPIWIPPGMSTEQIPNKPKTTYGCCI